VRAENFKDNMATNRRIRLTLAMAALCLAALAPTAVQAQSWPSRPVTMIVPFPPGGTADVLARSTAKELGDKLGQQFVIDNRGGASGNVGGTAAAKATPDGYTILFSTPGPILLNKLMTKNMSYDPERDLRPIVAIAKSPQFFVTSSAAPAKDVQALTAYARANPGKLNVGSPGIGTTSHIALELWLNTAGIKMTHVPYRGGGPLTNDLLGGQVEIGAGLVPTFLSQVNAGMLHALAVTSPKRSPLLPDVPTMQEAGFPGFEATAWYVLAAPTGTPADVIQKINAVMNEFLQSEKGRQLLVQLDMQAAGGTPEDARTFLTDELAKWAPIIKASNISM
jgi:tripartite-type tricarboxylate transporter receptor subunit TctC